jgi:O-antigen ligase
MAVQLPGRGRAGVRTILASPRALSLMAVVAVPPLVWTTIRHESLAAAAVSAAAFGCLAVARTNGAVLLLVAAIPALAMLRHGPTVFLAALAVLGFALATRSTTAVPSPRGRLFAALPLLAMVTVSYAVPALSMPTQTSRYADFVGLVGGLLLVAVVTAAAPSPRRLAQTIGAAGAAEALYVLSRSDYADHRLEGLGLNPNYLGLLAALPLVACLGLARRRGDRAWLLAAAPCFAVVAATQSRGAFLAAAAGAVMVLAAGRSLQMRVLMTVGALAVALLLPGSLGAVENSGASDRSAAELSNNDDVRAHAARFALDVALAHPLRGIGYDMFAPYAADSPDIGMFINTHDDYLRLAAEAGLPALAFFLALLAWACRDRGRRDTATLRAVVVAYAVGLLFANTLSNLAVTGPFWAALGVLLARPPSHAPTDAAPSGRPTPSLLLTRSAHADDKH